MREFICVKDIAGKIQVLHMETVANIVFHKNCNTYDVVVEYNNGSEFTLWTVDETAYYKLLTKLES